MDGENGMSPWQWCGVAVLALCFSGGVNAQSTYKCGASGSIYYSDRPCPADTKAAVVASTLPPPVPAQPAVDLRTEYIAYLGPECRSLKGSINALQGARSTAVRSDWELRRRQMADLLERYRGQCLEQERRALSRVYELDQAQRAQQRAEFAQRQAEQNRQAAEKDQCLEMRRIRQAKRQRVDTMSAGERADFERFETAFAARCEGVAMR
jgi:hypothetical protein